MKGSSHLNDALVDKNSGPSMSPADAPFRHAFGVPIFDVYGKASRLSFPPFVLSILLTLFPDMQEPKLADVSPLKLSYNIHRSPFLILPTAVQQSYDRLGRCHWQGYASQRQAPLLSTLYSLPT